MASTVTIEITPNVIGSRVFIDGVELTDVRGVGVYAEVGEVSRVSLQLVATRVEIRGAVGEVLVQDVTELKSEAREFRHVDPAAEG